MSVKFEILFELEITIYKFRVYFLVLNFEILLFLLHTLTVIFS